MEKNVIIIGVEVDPEKSYTIEDVATLTGYTTGYIRSLERRKKIPQGNRDNRGWRTWLGSEIASIVKYCKSQHMTSNPNLIGNKLKQAKIQAEILAETQPSTAEILPEPQPGTKAE